MRLKNKVAIITGAGSGIGQATAILFAQEGAKVVVNDEHGDEADEVVKQIKKAEGEAISIQANVTKEDEVKKLIKETIKAYGQIDILVNNAGIYRGHSVPDTTEDEWYEVMDNNLKGPFLCCKHTIPKMLKQKGGKIINISSIGGLIALEGSASSVSSNILVSAFLVSSKSLVLSFTGQ